MSGILQEEPLKNQNHSSRRAAKPADNPKKNARAEGLSAVQASILRCLQQSPSSLTARSLMKQLRTSPERAESSSSAR